LIDKQRVARSFNAAAATYDRYADVQRKMACQLLDSVIQGGPSPQRVLEVGCGTGYLTALLSEAFPRAEIVALDLAEAMVSEAKRRVATDRVTFIVADAEAWSATAKGSYDLIISNAAIQWFTQPQTVLEHWFRLLRPGGRMVAGTFGSDTFVELHRICATVEKEWGLPTQTHGLPLLSAARWKVWLDGAGWMETEVREERVKVEFASCRQFLSALKKTGASHSQSRLPLATERRLLKEVMNRYDREYAVPDGVIATYHVLLMEGKKTEKTCQTSRVVR
jgi:malonyl-CoA O-methyltransferase